MLIAYFFASQTSADISHINAGSGVHLHEIERWSFSYASYIFIYPYFMCDILYSAQVHSTH